VSSVLVLALVAVLALMAAGALGVRVARLKGRLRRLEQAREAERKLELPTSEADGNKEFQISRPKKSGNE